MSRLPDIVSALERGGLLVGTPDLHTWPDITGLTADSRRIAPGMLYCAVRGSTQDGHQFVAAARERGAVAALVEHEQPVELPQVLVRDGRRAAAVAAETWFGRPATRLDLVGVTGTSGKTTSVLLARHVLSALEPMGSIGTLGAFDRQFDHARADRPAGDAGGAGGARRARRRDGSLVAQPRPGAGGGPGVPDSGLHEPDA